MLSGYAEFTKKNHAGMQAYDKYHKKYGRPYLHTVEATGSIPVPPTIYLIDKYNLLSVARKNKATSSTS